MVRRATGSRWFFGALALIVVAGLAACGGSDSGVEAPTKPDEAASESLDRLSLADVLDADLTWGSELIPDLPEIRTAAQIGDDSVWVLAGGRGEPASAIQVDLETLEAARHEFDQMTGDLTGLVADDGMWILDRQTGEVATMSLSDQSFTGPAVPPEVTAATETHSEGARLLSTSDGAVWMQRRFMLWRLNPSDPGAVIESVDLREAIPPSTDRSDFPFFTVMSTDDQFLVEADRKFYLLDPDGWQFTALDIPSLGNAFTTAATSLPVIESGVVAYVSTDRDLVTLDLDSHATTVTEITLPAVKKSNVANSIFGVSGANGLVAVAGNHTGVEVIDPDSGVRSLIDVQSGSRSETQVFVTDISVWTWSRNGHEITVWTPRSGTS